MNNPTNNPDVSTLADIADGLRELASAGVFTEAHGIQAIKFFPYEGDIPNVIIDFLVDNDNDRIQFHIWPRKKRFIPKIREYLTKIFPDNTFLEYVPEVNSWYAEIKLAFPAPDSYGLEILKAVEKKAKEG